MKKQSFSWYVGLFFILFGIVVGCGGTEATAVPPSSDETPLAGPSMGMPVENFTSLEEMFESADAVVVAEVTGETPGRTAGEGDEALNFTDYTLDITQVLKGPADMATLKIEGVTGITSLGVSYQTDNTYLLFLRVREDLPSGYYREVSPQGVFTVGPDGQLVASVNDSITQEIAGKTLDEAVQILSSN